MDEKPNDLILVDRVMIRVGSAQTDEDFENVLGKFLPPLLLKLSSTEEPVRIKIMELLGHIMKRLKARPTVQLPVEVLLTQYVDPSATMFLKNFAIIYIKMGYVRLTMDKQVKLLHLIVKAISSASQLHQDSLLLLIMPVFAHMTSDSNVTSENLKKIFPSLNEATQETLTGFMLDILLLPYGVSWSSETPSAPGMSSYGFRRVGSPPFKPEILEQTKLGILKFISSGIFGESNMIIHFVVGASDTRFQVANFAENHIKRISGILAWDNKSTVLPLYDLFLGTQQMLPIYKKTIKEEQLRTPACTRIKLKLMKYILRAHPSSVIFPVCMEIFEDCVFSENCNMKLKEMALDYCFQIVKAANDKNDLEVIDKLLLSLLSLHDEQRSLLRGKVFNCIGFIGKKFPEAVGKDVTVLTALFKALTIEDIATKQYVLEAALNLTDAYKSAFQQGIIRNEMEVLLKMQMSSEEHLARFVAIRFLGTIFPTDFVPSSYLLLCAISDGHGMVSSEAAHLLFKSIKKGSVGGSDKVKKNAIFDERLPPFIDLVNYIEERRTITEPSTNDQNEPYIPFNNSTHSEVIKFLALCLIHGAGEHFSSDDINLELASQPTTWSPAVTQFLRHICDSENGRLALQRFVHFCLSQLEATHTETAVCCLLTVAASGSMSEQLLKKLPWLEKLLSLRSEATRCASSALVGVVAAQATDDHQFEEAVTRLLELTQDKERETQHGAILAIGYAIERKIANLKLQNKLEKLDNLQICETAINKLISYMDLTVSSLVVAACMSIGMAGRCTDFPPQSLKVTVVSKIQALITNKQVSIQIKEKIVGAAGLLCIGESIPHRQTLMEAFLELSKQTRDVELHFTLAEALSRAVLGSLGVDARDAWIQEEAEFLRLLPSPAGPNQLLSWLLTQLHQLATTDHPSSTQAAAVSLLRILRDCSSYAEIKSSLCDLQNTFLVLLPTNIVVVRDVATAGLTLVYECADEETRGRLLAAFKLRFTGSHVALAPLRELYNVSLELNKPHLIYTFMVLASTHSVWNSAKGCKYGFSGTLARAQEEVSALGTGLAARLFRYTHDPRSGVQAAASSVFAHLSPTSVEAAYEDILRDLMAHLNSPDSRVRLACCRALADLLRGDRRRLLGVTEHLPRLWQLIFRVMDDSVDENRDAAALVAHKLHKITMSLGEPLTSMQLPDFIKTGTECQCINVRLFCTVVLSEYLDEKEQTVKPHIDRFIHYFLIVGGETEFGGSMLLKCLKFVDENNMKKVVDSVIGVMRFPVGMTLDTCSSFVSRLAEFPALRPYAGKLLRLLDNAASSTGAAAAAAGTVVALASAEDIRALITVMRARFIDYDENFVQNNFFKFLHAVAEKSPEILKMYSKEMLPLVFLAMHYPDAGAGVMDTWNDVWYSMTPGLEVGALSHAGDICAFLGDVLRSSSLNLRTRVANAVCTMSKLESQLPDDIRQKLSDLLCVGLSGRTWEGKENFLIAAETFVSKNRNILKMTDTTQLESALLRECAKNKLSYKKVAVKIATTVLTLLERKEFQKILVAIDEICDESEDAALEAMKTCLEQAASSATLAILRRLVERLEPPLRLKSKLYTIIEGALGQTNNEELSTAALELLLALGKKIKARNGGEGEAQELVSRFKAQLEKAALCENVGNIANQILDL